MQYYSNGQNSASVTINLMGTVASNDVFVVAQSSADAAILAQVDQMNGAGWFNGNDAVVLRQGGANGVILDVIGQIGVDPGPEWGSGLTSTQDNTLRRQLRFCTGDTNPDDPFDPAAQWEGFASNTFDGLGNHIAGCGNGGGSAPVIVINEVDADTPGTDAAEFIELYDGGVGNTSLTGLVVVLYNGSNNAGYASFDVSGYTTNDDGYFVLGNAGTANVDLIFSNNFLQNGADAVALYQGTAADFPDGASISTHEIIDAVVYDTDDADDAELLDLLNEGQPQVNEDENNNKDNESLQRIPNGGGGLRITDHYTALAPTPGAQNSGDIVDPPVEPGQLTLIHHIQGTTDTSPLAGRTVRIRGIVVGDFQENDGDFFGTDLDGFYVQEEAGDFDDNDATSEGIFVYTNTASVNIPDVTPGDTVEVTGSITEFNGLTEVTNISSIIVSEGNILPEPVSVTLPATDEELERYESMLASFTQPLVISEYFNYDRYNEVVLSLPLDGQERPFVPTSYIEPGAEAAAVAEALVTRRITLDDARSIQNPDMLYHPNGQVFNNENNFRGGDIVENATGILSYSFGLFRIQPTTGAGYIKTNPRSAFPEGVGGTLKVASFNVLNYFTTLGSAGRGADNQAEFERQRAKIIAAISAINADIVGLIEIENNAGAIEDLVNGLNGAMGEGTYDYVNTGVIGTDQIKVAFIYKPATVELVGDHAILDSETNPGFIDTRNRPALAQTFQKKATGGVFTVAVNHLKSKGSGCGAGDDDPQQGNCNFTRTQAAEALVDWLATDPTASNDPDFLIIGDLNAYDEEDPIDAIKKGADDISGTEDDFIDLVEQFNGEFAYSYVFDGQFGYLDYALASKSLLEQVMGATDWHINSDETDAFDYNTNFRTEGQLALYEPTPYRASDHDPVIVGLSLVPPVCASEPALPILKKNGKAATPKILLDQGRCHVENIVQHVKLRGFEDQHKLVVVSKHPITVAPEDGVVYEASTVVGEGDAMAAGVFVVQNNNLQNSDFTLTDLEAEASYYIAAFIYTSGERCGPNYLPEIVATASFQTKSSADRSGADNRWDKLQEGLLNAYPNPVHDILYVNVPSETDQQIEILLSDIWGSTRSLGNFKVQAGDNKLEFNLQDLQLPKRWYLLKVKSQNQVYPVIRLWLD